MQPSEGAWGFLGQRRELWDGGFHKQKCPPQPQSCKMVCEDVALIRGVLDPNGLQKLLLAGQPS